MDYHFYSCLGNIAQITNFDIEDDSRCLELYEIVVVCIQLLKKDGRPDTRMSPPRLYVPARPAKPTSCPCHGRQLCHNMNMCGPQVTIVIVALHAFTNVVEVVKPIILTHVKATQMSPNC